jgi:PrtD family type I secretion system ABC transporter
MNGQYRRNELNAAFWSGGWLLGLAFLFSFFVTLLMLTSPMFMLLIYDRVLSSRSQETLVALFGLVVVLMLLMALFDYSRGRILARFGARLQERLESRVLQAVEARASRTRAAAGAPASGTRELDGLRSFFHSSSLIALLDFIWAPVFLGAVFLFHPLLGWVAVTGVIMLFLLAVLRAGFCSHLVEEAEAATGAVGRLARQIQEAQRTILTQGMARPAVESWLSARQASRDAAILLNDRTQWFATCTKHMRLLFQVTVLALGAHLVLSNDLTVGGMVACFILLVRVFHPVEAFLKHLPAIRRAVANWRALDAILKSAPPSRAAGDPSGLGGGVEVRELRVRRPDGQGMLLDGVGFSVRPGNAVQISGASGAGKSVLARALLGQQGIASGSITLGGRNIEQFGAEEIARLVGYLPEEIGFYPGSIMQNIARLGSGASMKDVVAAARRAGAHAMISGLPKGYHTQIDADGAPLSRVQRQKVALARALYGAPMLLVLDEPAEVLPSVWPAGPEGSPSGGPAIVILGRARALPPGSRRCALENGRLVEVAEDRTASAAAARTPKLVNG